MADFAGFVGPSYVAPSMTQDAQECINWFVEIDPAKPDGSRGKYTLYPTPGLTLKCQLPAGEVRALHVAPDGLTMLAICGSSLYSLDSSYTATLKGSLYTSGGYVSITDNGLSAYICDGLTRYAYVFASGALSVIAATDGAFTGGTRADVSDNYILYGRPNSQQWAATDALSTVTQALSFASADGTPDRLVGPVVINRQVFLLKEFNSEVWIDAGLFPFPFQRIPGTSSQHGCAAIGSIARLGDSFAFVSQDKRGQALILQAQGYGFAQISNHAVTNSLLGQTVSDAVAYSYQMEGHEFYVVTFPSADITWVYDLATQMWHKWLSTDPVFGTFHRHRSNCQAVFGGSIIVGDYANGKLYAIDRSNYTEDGARIRRLRRSPHITDGLKQVYVSRLQIQFQPGTGLETGQGAAAQVMLRWSNDGGMTWSNEHWRSIGAVGKYRARAIWRRLGQARDRVYEISISDPVNAVIISADLDSETGDN